MNPKSRAIATALALSGSKSQDQLEEPVSRARAITARAVSELSLTHGPKYAVCRPGRVSTYEERGIAMREILQQLRTICSKCLTVYATPFFWEWRVTKRVRQEP